MSLLRRTTGEKTAFDLLTSGATNRCAPGVRSGNDHARLSGRRARGVGGVVCRGTDGEVGIRSGADEGVAYSIDGMSFEVALDAGVEVNVGVVARTTGDTCRGFEQFTQNGKT